MELRPLNESDDELLSSLEQQEDVWEFIGTLPLPDAGHSHHRFAIMEGQTSVGIAGLVRSEALDGKDFELLCAMRSEAPLQGRAKQPWTLALAWAFDTAKLKRIIACIDDSNEGARSIAARLGMKPLCAQPPSRTVYVRYRDERSVTPTIP
ncbi:MAG: GNAT family N-acetyltransferase [Candidatus Methylomirabilaceae bacterium]